jgi:hypothetical protein
MFFRLLLYGLLFMFTAKLLKAIVTPVKTGIQVGGEPKNPSLDLSKEDVQDVKYKEIKD